MRRTFGVVLSCLSVVLLAAAPPGPTPIPKVTPVPSALPTSLFPPVASPAPSTKAPTVVIYPFETPTDVNKNTGSSIAQIYAQVLSQSGGLTVLEIPQNVKREDFTKYAHSRGADYYISGYVQPIGTGAAIVANIVDVNNEIAVYSQTTQIQSVPEVGSQALNARSVILQAAGIDRPSIVTSNATPEPESTSGASVSINSIVGDLFKGKKKGPNATPTPLPPKPSRAVIVGRVIGNADQGDLTRGTSTLQRMLATRFNVTTANVAENELSSKADTICGSHRDNTLASGVLNATHIGGVRSHNSYTFKFNVYTCFGSVLYSDTETNDDLSKAITNAVDAYAKDHPTNS